CDHLVEVDRCKDDDSHKEESGGIGTAFVIDGLDFKPVSHRDKLLKAEIGEPGEPISQLREKADRRPGQHQPAPKPKKKAPAIGEQADEVRALRDGRQEGEADPSDDDDPYNDPDKPIDDGDRQKVEERGHPDALEEDPTRPQQPNRGEQSQLKGGCAEVSQHQLDASKTGSGMPPEISPQKTGR